MKRTKNLFLAGMAALALPFMAVPGAAQTAPAAVYKVGDTGPAGGLIFYDKGNDAGGWRYMEAAPADTEKETYWASEVFNIESIKGLRAVGEGKGNAEYIMRVANDRGGGYDWAAEICDSLVVNGYDDWFLPNRDELHHMYGNLQRKGLGGFKNAWYWSSTIVTGLDYYDRGNLTIGAYIENFVNGEQGYTVPFRTDKKNRVRAIRQF